MEIYVTCILAGLLIGLVYRRRPYLPTPKGVHPFYSYRVLLLLLSMIIAPILIMNLFFYERFYSADELMKLNEKYNQTYKYERAL